MHDPTYLTKAGTYGTGNYFISGNVTIDDAINFNIRGNVNLILADGAKLTVNGGISGGERVVLNIYGQSAGTGTLNSAPSGANAISLGEYSDLNIYGGIINVAGNGPTAISSQSTIAINGGQVTATCNNGYGIHASRGITLSWTQAKDFINANSYSGTVTFASGKRFYDESGNVNSTSGGKLTPLDGYIVTVPAGVTVTDATKIGTTDKYIVAANGTITVSNFTSGDITFDELITSLARDNSNITATTSDGKSFTVSGLTFASDTTTWTLDNTTANYNRKIVAGTKVDNAKITWDSTTADVSFKLTGLKENLGDKITVIGNDIYVGTTKIGTLTITDGNYAVELDRNAALAETPTKVELTGTGATFALTIKDAITEPIADSYTWSDIANGELTYTLNSKNESWTKDGNSYTYQAGRDNDVQQFKLTGLNSNFSGSVTVDGNNIYVGKTADEAGMLIGTFTGKAIALNANALPKNFTTDTTTKFAEGVLEGYTLNIITTGDNAVHTESFTPAIDGNAGIFVAVESDYKFSSPTYKEYFSASNNTINGRTAIDSKEITLTTVAELDLAEQTVAFDNDNNKTSVITLKDGTVITFTATTDATNNLTGHAVTLDDKFLAKVAQGESVTLSGGTFADLPDTVAIDANKNATKSATFSKTGNIYTYTAQITAGDYFSKKSSTEIEHVAQVGGQKFSLSSTDNGINPNIDINSFTVVKGTGADVGKAFIYLKANAFNGDGKIITLTDDASDIGGKLEYKLAYDTDGTKGGLPEHDSDAEFNATLTVDQNPDATTRLATVTYKTNTIDASITIDGNTVTYTAESSGDPFTLKNVYVPEGYTLALSQDKKSIVATKAEDTTIIATVDGYNVELQAGAFNTQSTTINTIDASAAANGSQIIARDANSYITAGNQSLNLIGGTGNDT